MTDSKRIRRLKTDSDMRSIPNKASSTAPLSSAPVPLHENYFRPLVENASDVILIQGADGIIRYISPAIEKSLDYTAQDVIGHNVFEFVHPDDLSTAQSAFQHRLMTPGPASEPTELRVRHRNGSWRTFQFIGNNCLDDPVISGIVVNLRDITEHQLAQQAIQASEARLRLINNNMLDVVSQVDLTGTHLYVSPSFKKVLGYDPIEVIGTTVYDYVHPDDMPPVIEAIQAAIVSRTGARIEYRFRHADGHYMWLEAMGSFLFDEAGEPVGAVLAARDVTARRQREGELRAIAAVSAAVRSAQSRAEMIPVVLDYLMELLQADGAALALSDAETGETVVEMARGTFVASIGMRIKPGQAIGIESSAMANVPLIAYSETIGTLWIGRTNPIDKSELRLITAIADIAANAIHREMLHEQTESRLQRLMALSTINKAISSTFDLQVTLNILLDQVTVQLHVDAAAALLFDSSMQMLQFLAGRGIRQPASRLILPFALNEDYAGHVVRDGVNTIISDLVASPPPVPIRRLVGENFRAYVAVPLVAKGQIKGVLEVFHRQPLKPDAEWMEFLEVLARDAAIAIDNIELFQGLQRSNSELLASYDATLEGWSRALDLRDSVTEGHTQRVVGLTLRLARAMQLPESELPNLRRGALLHDIGKIGVPDAILRKPSSLVDEEWKIMRKHPVYAFNMLSPITYLRPALEIPYAHHEHWDGSGYPRGLKGEEIPLAARIFSIVDVWDALCSDRPYRNGLPAADVRQYIRESAGTLFDPAIAAKFLELVAND
ncbi:MAG: PAS domain S-box protein [Chloroflexi bacterium]|nr:PAS domain S-box protein [Chloroflexota bacterium]